MNITWQETLAAEKQKDYFKNIIEKVNQARAAKEIIYPKNTEIFNALKTTELHQVKVVILGQDPYHGPNQAHGLCFSVNHGITPPPSLVNIFKELRSDLGLPIPKHGCLTSWAEQGVLLLNSSLTVKAGSPLSHAKLGWEIFTDYIIKLVSDRRTGVVFLLWGSFAQKKAVLIDHTKHLILQAPHPSPLSSHRGFFGCKHFSKTNEYLANSGHLPINWSLKTEALED